MVLINSESKSSHKAQLPVLNGRNRKVYLPFKKEQYKGRHLVEGFFQKLKRYRRGTARCDKLAKRFLAFYSPLLHFYLVILSCLPPFSVVKIPVLP